MVAACGAVKIKATMRNVGKSPLVVDQVRVDTIIDSDGGRLGNDCERIAGSILHAGDAREVELLLPRITRLGKGNVTVNFDSVRPSQFEFTVTYTALDEDAKYTDGPITFPGLTWTKE